MFSNDRVRSSSIVPRLRYSRLLYLLREIKRHLIQCVKDMEHRQLVTGICGGDGREKAMPINDRPVDLARRDDMP